MDASTTAASISSTNLPADFAARMAECTDARQLAALRGEARRRDGHAVDPEKDGLAYLEVEHDSISEAMHATIDRAQAWCDKGEGDPDEVDRLLSRMVALVSQHASLEERYVYPLFRDHLKGVVRGITADLIYERNVVDDNINKQVLDLLLKMSLRKDGRLMLGTMRKFQTIEDEHLFQEEHWFALLRSQMSAPDLATLAATLRSAASTAPTRPHSLVGPSHALPARMAHPIAGVLDRGVDKLTGRDVSLDTEKGGPKHVTGIAHEKTTTI